MKFPITKEELQRFDYTIEMKQKREKDIDAKIEVILQNLCKEFERSIQTSFREKRFIWRPDGRGEHGIFTDIFVFIQQYSIDGAEDKTSLFDCKKKYLVEKIRKLFVDCDIIIDPLHTYIIIDWSK